MKILGISGCKQAGKNTTANIIVGHILKREGKISDFKISESGELVVPAVNPETNEVEYSVLPYLDRDWSDWCEENLWDYVKVYSFADILKGFCMAAFGLTYAQCYGSDDDKNSLTKINWEDMPLLRGPTAAEYKKKKGPMTARELLQVFGTQICRNMNPLCWCEALASVIDVEQPKLAIITDVRFPNEVEFIKSLGGKVLRLTRRPFVDDNHASETSTLPENFDWSNFDIVYDNTEKDIPATAVELIELLYTQELYN